MKALVLRTGALGDFVATLPVLSRLREAADVLEVVAPPRYRVLFPSADRWVDPESAEVSALFAGKLVRDDVDVGIAWTSAGADALTSAGIRDVLRGTPRPPPGTPISDHLWAPLVPRFGPRDRDPRVVPETSAVEAVRRRLSRPPVVVAPGSGGATKKWPASSWRAVAERLEDVLWVGGPLEAADDGWGTPRWDDLDLSGLAALASLCRCWLGPDSGPSHLAAAVGARVGVVFTGVTDPRCWAPPGARVFDADVTPAQVAMFADDGGGALS